VRIRISVLLWAGLALVQTANATAGGRLTVDPQVAGLQVALTAHRYYAGAVDALAGTQTSSAVRSLQRHAHLPVTGVATPATLAALGPLGRPRFGDRVIRRGMVGLDVSVLQFLLAVDGYDVGTLDGRFGPRTRAALVAYQTRRRLVPDGVAGPATRLAICPAPCASVPLPAARSQAAYRVRAGDTLTAIAARAGTTVAALAEQNGLDPNGVLLAGARLRLPSVRLQAVWPDENLTQAQVRALVERFSVREGVKPRLALAVAWIESGYQANVRSSTGDWGPMQVSSPAWDFVEGVLAGRAVPHTASGNVRVGLLYLRRLLREFGGDERLAVAAYHQGAAGVRRYGLLPETESYVGAVLAVEQRS
jgi:peptidoglycan hydrolase-like protein with peptidoglycan-binding domain